jgi:DinB superfamily
MPTECEKLMKTRSAEIKLLLKALDEAYSSKAWHGPNLRGSLRGVTAEMAAWRPGPKRHNIWEIAVHAAYWKYVVRRRLVGEKRGSFALKGSNWFLRPVEASERAWREELRLLESEHRRLREVIERVKPEELELAPAGSQVTNLTLIFGIAAHDIYHAGQIQLLKRLH